MLTSKEIRQNFLDFFKSKNHEIVKSDSMIIKNDPTLMFTNAGMNQFKSIILGNEKAKHIRVANTQKCLRVSGKHNDLEEVGIDTYHHTMFEMLGNWSFGDYFKKEAIDWAWELLVEKYKIDKERIYATVFGGDETDNLPVDEEAITHWQKYLPKERILKFSKKDNFWEMGYTGPCGPCSEIHVDIRPEEDRKKIDGKTLVNTGHPLVIEIWNLVFMEFNRDSNNKLNPLPFKNVDTGMGFERLCMVLQNKKSNYDTDLLTPFINHIEKLSNKKYNQSEEIAISMRVLTDHIRTVSFAISDGQIPSNNKAGYVIKRILRRAIRYGYSFLDFKEPFFYKLVETFVDTYKEIFPEIISQKKFIQNVIKEEEALFLKTLSKGITLFENYLKKDQKEIEGDFAFELYDTYGFPLDLTELLAREKNLKINVDGFNKAMEKQQDRSRTAALKTESDWVIINETDENIFVGYNQIETEVNITKYRKISTPKGEYYQLVFDKTPFYAESGGQIGDTGIIIDSNENKYEIYDTQKENNLIYHLIDLLPEKIDGDFIAKVNPDKRINISRHHTATHLMHAALRMVLGHHVEQRGSLVTENKLRFDFSHFAKMTTEELNKVEDIVNEKIQEQIEIEINIMELNEAKEMGARALFGEKYGEMVRVVIFDKEFSMELCGGTHVNNTRELNYFKIISEQSVASGIRRIEAKTSEAVINFLTQKAKTLDEIEKIIGKGNISTDKIKTIIENNNNLEKKIKKYIDDQTVLFSDLFIQKLRKEGEYDFILIDTPYKIDPQIIRNCLNNVRKRIKNGLICIQSEFENKYHIGVGFSDNFSKEYNANTLVNILADLMEGKGGGSSLYAVASGTKKLSEEKIKTILLKLLKIPKDAN